MVFFSFNNIYDVFPSKNISLSMEIYISQKLLITAIVFPQQQLTIHQLHAKLMRGIGAGNSVLSRICALET